MKKILTAFVLMIFVWGCAKKISPANSNSGSASANTQTMPADNNIGKGAETANTATQSPTDNSATFGAKNAEKEATANLTEEEIAVMAGQKVYNAKCGSCHGLKVTTDFTAERWASILVVMAPRARLSDAEKESVYTYVKMNSKK